MRRASGLRRGLRAIDLLAAALLLAVGGSLLLPALMAAKERSNCHVTCSNRLRTLGSAARCYADTQRAYPGLARPGRPAGGPESDHASRVTETLGWYGYLNRPDALICPSSWDQPQPFRSPGGPASGTPSPLYDPAAYPPLDRSTRLSYGWTRRRMHANTGGAAPLAADRAVFSGDPGAPPDPLLLPGRVGNHAGGLNVLQVDGAVVWISDPALLQALVKIDPADPGSGWMGIYSFRARTSSW